MNKTHSQTLDRHVFKKEICEGPINGRVYY